MGTNEVESRKQIEELDAKWQYYMDQTGRYVVYPETVQELISQALKAQRDADDEAFARAVGTDEDSYVWHTPDASMHNHMRIARNEHRAEARASWAAYRKGWEL